MSDNRIDLPPPGAANFNEKVREAISVYLGKRGDKLDRGVTLRDLVDSGVVELRGGYLTNGGKSPVVGPGASIVASAAATYNEDLTPPPTPTGTTVTAGLSYIYLETDDPTFTVGNGYARTKVYGVKNAVGSPLFSAAQLIHEFVGSVGSFPSDTGTQWNIWMKWETVDGVLSTLPSGLPNGQVATTGKIGNTDLGPLIIEAGNLASGAVTASKLAAAAIDATKFASSIEPVSLVTSVPLSKSTSTIFNSTDGKLYRWNGAAYVATIPAADVSGTLIASQIADAAITTAKFASSIEPLTIVTGALPTTKSTNAIFRTDDSKTYRWNGTAYVASVPTADLTGTITGAQIADAAVTTAKFASSIEPVTVVTSVPGTKSTSTIFNTTDGKLYRWSGSAYVATIPTVDLSGTVASAQIADGAVVSAKIADAALTTAKFASGIEPIGVVTSVPVAKTTNTVFNSTDGKLYRWSGSAYIASVPAGDLSGTIVGTQITDGAISTAKIAANAITAAKIAAGTITATEIAADTITAGQIAAGAISASEIAAGAITTDRLLVTGKGAAINDDPGMMDASAWGNSEAFSFVTITDGVSGLYAARSSANTSTIYSRNFAINPTKTYRVRCKVNPRTGNGTMYLVAGLRDSAGTQIARDGSHWYYPISGAAPTAGWNEYSGSFGAGQGGNVFPAAARSMYIGIYLNYNGTVGYMEVQDLRLEEYIGADLIVDGAISANKIAANAVTAAKIAANTITANEIAANTITASQIAANTITASQIAADTITAGQIATSAITASEIATGAITTSKLLVTGRGQAINDDPGCVDQSAWTGWSSQSAATVTAITDGKTGNSVLRATGGTRSISSKLIPASSSKTYRLSAWVRQSATGNGLLYLRTVDYAGTEAVSAGTERLWGIEAVSPPANVWTYYSAQVTVGAGRVNITPHILLAWNGTVGYMEAQDIRIEEMADASLIVDGAITTAKLTANAVTAAKIAAGTITANEIATDTITAGNIAAGAISTTELAANAVTAAKIAVGTITANEIAANTITAAKIASATITSTQIAADTITAGNIAAGAISASEIATGAITTSKLLVTGRGKALNADPTFQDASAWVNTGGGGTLALVSEPTSPVGTRVLRATNDVQFSNLEFFPATAGTRYKLSCWVRRTAGTGVVYLRVYFYTQAGGFTNVFAVTQISPAVSFEGFAPSATWTKYIGYIDAPATATQARIITHVNWATTGTTDVADMRCEEYIGADLIVDGAISATKLAAGSIAVGTAAIQNGAIVNAMLGTASVDNAQIANLAVTDAKIAAATITSAKIASLDAGKITTGTLDAARIAAGSITATMIDSRGLSIKDASGNIILASGSPLAAANITPAAGWLNSNVTATGIGAVQTSLANAPAGILNSNVTATGIGAVQTSLANAPAGILNSNVTATGIGAVQTSLANAPAGILNSSVSISSAGVLSGAGGGTVSIAGLDNTVVRSVNPITSSNVSTYIASAAITDAYIGSLNASKITAGSITTEKLQVGAATASAVSILSAFGPDTGTGNAHILSYVTLASIVRGSSSSAIQLSISGRIDVVSASTGVTAQDADALLEWQLFLRNSGNTNVLTYIAATGNINMRAQMRMRVSTVYSLPLIATAVIPAANITGWAAGTTLEMVIYSTYSYRDSLGNTLSSWKTTGGGAYGRASILEIKV